ncbi:MAG: restriction endonuclease [Isosphaeraceae bacterium]
MECLGPQCAAMLLDWFRNQAQGGGQAAPASGEGANPAPARQGSLFASAPYDESASAIRTPAELSGALEHLEYAIFRRYQNVLTRAERARLDNTIENALFKAERYVARLDAEERARIEDDLLLLKKAVREGRERVERMHRQAQRADLKLAQLGSLTPEGFEEFVAELFEAMGYEVETVGGSGDEGADLRVKRGGLLAVVQCKYHTRGVVGSPELQKFLGTVHHTRSHKGFFVTTRTFSLAAEKFVAQHPIELIDGPRLVELVQDALGPGAKRAREPQSAWF